MITLSTISSFWLVNLAIKHMILHVAISHALSHLSKLDNVTYDSCQAKQEQFG